MSDRESQTEEHDGLELTSLDAESLFTALGAVEKAVPDLLLSAKPVLQHLTSPYPDRSAPAANEAVEKYMATLDKIQFVLRQTVYYLRETQASTTALRPPPVNAIPTPFAASLPDPMNPSRPAAGSADQAERARISHDAVDGKAAVNRDTTESTGPSGGDEREGGEGEADARLDGTAEQAEQAESAQEHVEQDEEGELQGKVELGLYGSRMEAKVLRDLEETLRRIKRQGLHQPEREDEEGHLLGNGGSREDEMDVEVAR